jgi:ferredoxin
MRIVTHPDRCVGSGNCALNAPGVFDQGTDGIIRVLREQPGDAELDEVRQAEYLCPARVIELRDE